VYKAVSSKDGKMYALRRLEGYRLLNEKAIRSVQAWKRVDNGSVVTIHEAFTTGAFGDRSLIFVTDYHPLSKTLAEQHFGPAARFAAGGGGGGGGGRMPGGGTHVPEQLLWSYCVQLASALKTIHGMGLAARLIDASKVLLTSKGRVRLNGCAVLDVVQYDVSVSTAELQQDDLLQLGRLLLALACGNAAAAASAHQMPKALEHVARAYSTEFKDSLFWLLSPPASLASASVSASASSSSSAPPLTAALPTAVAAPAPLPTPAPAPTPAKTIDHFLQGIAGQVAHAFNHALHLDDALHSELARALEHGRLVRLMAKLNFVNERPEFEHDRQWAETGDRYLLKLFRDHVFHQVDAHGAPAIDLAHVLACLNKLDAGIDERVTLVSRDEQNCLVVSYRELKRGVESAFQDLLRAGQRK
jgi:PAB-dependent poly(A)-specific ribonuclease subunit 3